MRTLTNARIVTSQGWTAGWLRVDGPRIAEVGAGIAPYPAAESVDLGGRLLVPGWVDIHVHGGGGASFDDGDPERALAAVDLHRRHGTTSLVAGLVTASPAALLRQVAALAELCEAGELAGIHLEGPYLATQRCGAHDPALLRSPDLAEFQRILRAGRGHVRMITLAPELPGALELVRAAVSEGVVAAVGHTDADYATVCAAFDAGATVATHLFNQMRPLHHRDPGPVAAALTDDRVTVEVINDGVHLHPAVVRMAWAAAGADRTAFVTDAMAAAGLGDGDYTLGGRRVRVADGTARLADTGAIAGSTITLADAVRRAVRDLGIPLAAAVRAASTVPAAALRLADVGALLPGRYADLVVLEPDGTLHAVYHRGRPVTGVPASRGQR
ncbi:N-acetylglucosamine-6-phosphate deacetylase [Thermobifida fusca]|uniref:N-acetylglucosamine-6-phosphate deacetylase n=3 Tax=Thermobifida fusca TaxID=2021 RepID=Q47M16_THEFY|nr:MULTISPECIES: N-acetylglucosamine-6-phosphate deacetylase [Thermobifida]AAZ56506.1 N-acetylglucosamine 6-phosphate deacetylase [Thermobifida fusca YX]MBO2530465.1 N-acetylglucosamine-6-phosphate deacetylase [Thermobifida sp.]MDD6792997.1 N-acetylglucosamine-6-phosphate deacetylase [Thermobifida fusca]PPS93858.1 N-acetylglucosamine-6-phosphate deacetylase [Thermobifida fusca]PZN61265.1 MAG: N-acetylglucosamine-6-phosphate deacetylase [Thermobifida fusca]